MSNIPKWVVSPTESTERAQILETKIGNLCRIQILGRCKMLCQRWKMEDRLRSPPPSAKGRVKGEPMVRYFGKLLQENSLLPVYAWDTSVATLSVFSKTGWVDRWLTSKELAVSYDLPVALHKEWLSASKDLPFLSATPSKVLLSVSSALGNSLASTAKDIVRDLPLMKSGQLPPPLPATPRQRRMMLRPKRPYGMRS
jgi:hypothetical protein